MHDTRLHVAISAHLLASRGAAGYRSAGIHTYIANLLAHLPHLDPGVRYTIYTNAQPPVDARIRPAWLPTAKPLMRILWEQLAQPLALRRDRPDVLHAAAFVAPLASSCPAVVTVYDLSFALFPEHFRGPNQTYLSIFTRLSVRRARRVIAISEHTRRDVHRLYGVPLDHIDVAYPGVDARFRPMPREEVEAFRRKHVLPERFFLYLGTLEPRKNLDRLIDACRGLEIGDWRLVLVGGKGWRVDDLFARVKSHGLEQRVTFAGYAPAEDLPLWYNAATAFVYPSLYEGFGIPPLEAMACGTPVIASSAASLPEVVGDAGILVAPDDVQGLAQSMRRVWRDETLRGDLSRHGNERARRFTWEATARATLESYRRASGNPSSSRSLSSSSSLRGN
ncbi:MAG TPA: glycosyltransferase family 1 protein [Anaerolineae bacterium]|nr:glycosyltransferase family 1 protein [Anaerolineae bacterium]